MKLTVQPAAKLQGAVQLPASKSYSIRAFIIASCGGNSTIIHPSDCDDAVVSRRVAQSFGSKIVGQKNVWVVKAHAQEPKLSQLDVNESGTVLRFVLPLVSLFKGRSKVVGRGTLVGRPNKFLNQTLRQMGVSIHGQGEKESVPIIIDGGNLKAGRIKIDGSLSSQFISALLIACPRLAQDSRLELTGQTLVSSDYITMTRQILSKAGIKIKVVKAREYFIKGGQKFLGLKNFEVPSDFGLAAFLMAGASLIKSDVVLKGNLSRKFIQADGHIIDFLRKLGVRFQLTDKAIKIKGPFQLKGGSFSLKDCPDLVPIMAVLAMFAQGKTTLKDIGHARAKESDRISDLREELIKAGAKIEESRNSMTIYPQDHYKNNIHLDPHHDHRLAMAFAVLGLKLGVTISDIECTHKSYPGFVKDFQSLFCKK